MKKITLTAIVIIMLLTSSMLVCAQPANSWISKEPLPTPRTDLGVAVVNNKIYAIGGYPDLNVTEEYDPATDTWTTKADMPTARFNFAITVYENKIYCIGGLIASRDFYGNSSITGAIEVYDPATNTWEIKQPMPAPRTQLEANVVGNKIYLMGGRTGGQYSTVNLTEAYDPVSQSWTTKAPMPHRVTHYASATIGNKIYALGGQGEFNNPMCMNTTQIYDVITDSWSLGTALPTAIWDSAACVHLNDFSSNIYLIGGSSETSVSTNIVQVYNTKNDSWTTIDPMISDRFGLASAVVNGSIYAIGGTNRYLFPNEQANSENEMYTPHSEQTSPSSKPSSIQTQTSTPSILPSPTMSIIPTPSPTATIPEFSIWVVLSLLLVVAILLVIVCRRK